MTTGSRSYLKTVILAAAGGALIIAATLVGSAFETGPAKLLVELIGWPLGLLSECVAAGGLLVVYRSTHLDLGQTDLFLRLNEARSLAALDAAGLDLGMWVRRSVRFLLGGSWLLVGDLVEVRSLEEIERTLDESGCLDGMPFMSEMVALCGRRARVFRCVDKIYDYGRSKTLRRLKKTVLLAGLRCDGSAHGGCEAACYLLWNHAWLRPANPHGVGHRGRRGDTPRHAGLARRDGRAAPTDGNGSGCPSTNGGGKSTSRYTCQYTQLVAATMPLRPWDLRQDIRPLLAGNVTATAFGVAVLTRLFNAVQRIRGGSGFPAMSQSTLKKTPSMAHGLVIGERVRVLSRAQIATTLDATGRNRGLWFDPDMTKHCGRSHTVAKRVERIIDDASGKMIELKTPCIVLERVDASGEFLRFCPQNEHIFWREGWLTPDDLTPGHHGSQHSAIVTPTTPRTGGHR